MPLERVSHLVNTDCFNSWPLVFSHRLAVRCPVHGYQVVCRQELKLKKQQWRVCVCVRVYGVVCNSGWWHSSSYSAANHICIYIYIYVCVGMYKLYKYVCVYIYTYIYIYIYMFMHTPVFLVLVSETIHIDSVAVYLTYVYVVPVACLCASMLQ